MRLPKQLDGDSCLASTEAKLVDGQNETLVETLEHLSTSDPQEALAQDASKGLANSQGVALQTLINDKLIQANLDALKARLRASGNMHDLLATKGMTEVAMLSALRDIDKNLAMAQLEQAQAEINKRDEQKLLWDDRMAGAKLAFATGLGAAAAGQ